MTLEEAYCEWLVAAENYLDQFENNVFKIEYIEIVKAHILTGHRHYRKCKAIITTCEAAKVAKFNSIWPKLHEVYEVAYRCEIRGAMLKTMGDIEEDD